MDPLEGLLLAPAPSRWAGVQRASVEGAWTGAVAGMLTVLTMAVVAPPDGTDPAMLLVVTPVAAVAGAVVGSAVAALAAVVVLRLPAPLRRGLAASWVTLPLLALVVGAVSVGFSIWNRTSDERTNTATMFVLAAWSVTAVLWRGRHVLKSLRGWRGSAL